MSTNIRSKLKRDFQSRRSKNFSLVLTEALEDIKYSIVSLTPFEMIEATYIQIRLPFIKKISTVALTLASQSE